MDPRPFVVAGWYLLKLVVIPFGAFVANAIPLVLMDTPSSPVDALQRLSFLFSVTFPVAFAGTVPALVFLSATGLAVRKGLSMTWLVGFVVFFATYDLVTAALFLRELPFLDQLPGEPSVHLSDLMQQYGRLSLIEACGAVSAFVATRTFGVRRPDPWS